MIVSSRRLEPTFRVEPSIFIVALLGENTNLLIRLSVCPKNVHNLGCYLHSRSSFQYKYIDTCMDSRKLSVTSDAIIASHAIIIYGNVSYPRANVYSIYGSTACVLSYVYSIYVAHDTFFCQS